MTKNNRKRRKMNKKIVFFDIDGTLYDHETGVPKSTIEAIQQLIANGHIPVICTGRTRAMIPDYIVNMGFYGIVAGAGTYVEYKEEIIHNKVEDGAFAKRVLPLLDEHDVTYIVEGPEYIYYNGKSEEDGYGSIEFIKKIMPNEKIKLIDYNDIQMNKITARFPDEEIKFMLMPELKEIFSLISHQGTNFMELVPQGYNKATGIEKLTNYLNIEKQNTYAFGDSTNDLEMLDYVQYGIAMGNSYPEVLKRARYQTKSIQEDGIYYGLKDFGLI
jgi:Cof subfamily protein (haloacid dehalogenase superfamily)